jgi:hypothetical protein
VEQLHGERFLTLRQAKDAVLASLLWYHGQRMHSTLNYVSPAQYEQEWKQTRQGRGTDLRRLDDDGDIIPKPSSAIGYVF